MDEIFELKKQNLIKTIRNAEQLEGARMLKLKKIGMLNGERQKLLRRFEKERLMDQLEVHNLSNDLSHLQQEISSGTYEPPTANESVSDSISNTSQFDPSNKVKNRWVGLETHNEVLFYGSVAQKFDRYDDNFRRKQNVPIYHDTLEKHQLKLLNHKREHLKELMLVHITMGDRETTEPQQHYGTDISTGADTGILTCSDSRSATRRATSNVTTPTCSNRGTGSTSNLADYSTCTTGTGSSRSRSSSRMDTSTGTGKHEDRKRWKQGPLSPTIRTGATRIITCTSSSNGNPRVTTSTTGSGNNRYSSPPSSSSSSRGDFLSVTNCAARDATISAGSAGTTVTTSTGTGRTRITTRSTGTCNRMHVPDGHSNYPVDSRNLISSESSSGAGNKSNRQYIPRLSL